VKGLYILEDSVERNYEIHKADNLQARKVTTQIYYLRRIGVVVVVLIGLSVILSSFEPIQQLGTTLLASAGVAGIIIGVGAQKTVGSVVAGLQVAFTQPIRLDDVLIVENEWGRVEEITLTYVVVRIWDLRRLVLPITYFTERAFQNWTRMTADLLGTVYLYVDYTTPIDPIREELHRVLQQSEHWDGKVWNVQVTDATEKTMELRAMMSAKDASTLWDLRVEVREKLIAFLQSSYSDNLPRTRVRIGEAEVRSVDRSDGAPSDNDTETDDRSRDASGTAPAGYQEGAADHGNAEDGKGDA
jgi:small-conductance mechanosensitive channel